MLSHRQAVRCYPNSGQNVVLPRLSAKCQKQTSTLTTRLTQHGSHRFGPSWIVLPQQREKIGLRLL